ncbi:hypothetical protein FH972_022538 [Carpinus fangiana]|uniref:Uncharacterized protein n=1 Tax=Carpinus fangiana TaxID=176857 RepID=A0A5N6KSV1_9ROSI|nr:hypothetical protein FH972_022538 [Carpinus fangiana]
MTDAQDPSDDRPIYLLVSLAPTYSRFNGGRAHWKIFIPTFGPSSTGPGTTIESQGNPIHGYKLCFTRNYDSKTQAQKLKAMVFLGYSKACHVRDPGLGPATEDQNPIDDIERVAVSLPQPGSSDKNAPDPQKGQRCQTWTRNFIAALISADILPAQSMDVLDDSEKVIPFISSPLLVLLDMHHVNNDASRLFTGLISPFMIFTGYLNYRQDYSLSGEEFVPIQTYNSTLASTCNNSGLMGVHKLIKGSEEYVIAEEFTLQVGCTRSASHNADATRTDEDFRNFQYVSQSVPMQNCKLSWCYV